MVEQVGNRLAVKVLDLVFELLDAHGMVLRHAGVVCQALHAQMHLAGSLSQQGADLAHVVVGLDLQDRHLNHRGVGVIQHVIDGARQAMDILAVEGGDEGMVQLIDENAADLIRFGLELIDHISAALGGLIKVSREGNHTVFCELGLLDQQVDEAIGLALEHAREAEFLFAIL